MTALISSTRGCSTFVCHLQKKSEREEKISKKKENDPYCLLYVCWKMEKQENGMQIAEDFG